MPPLPVHPAAPRQAGPSSGCRQLTGEPGVPQPAPRALAAPSREGFKTRSAGAGGAGGAACKARPPARACAVAQPPGRARAGGGSSEADVRDAGVSAPGRGGRRLHPPCWMPQIRHNLPGSFLKKIKIKSEASARRPALSVGTGEGPEEPEAFFFSAVGALPWRRGRQVSGAGGWGGEEVGVGRGGARGGCRRGPGSESGIGAEAAGRRRDPRRGGERTSWRPAAARAVRGSIPPPRAFIKKKGKWN